MSDDTITSQQSLVNEVNTMRVGETYKIHGIDVEFTSASICSVREIDDGSVVVFTTDQLTPSLLIETVSDADCVYGWVPIESAEEGVSWILVGEIEKLQQSGSTVDSSSEANAVFDEWVGDNYLPEF